MHGKSTRSRQMTPQKLNRKLRAPTSGKTVTSAPELVERLDVGDWAIAQDENGALIIHNVMTGNRIVLGS